MEWVERRTQERHSRDERARVIETAVNDLWTDLCAAIRDSVEGYKAEAERRGEHVRANGQPYVTAVVYREARLPGGNLAPEGKATVTLDRGKPEITVAYEGKPPCRPQKFSFGVDDGTAAIFSGDHRMSVAAVAEAVLSPFLFPDLPPAGLEG